MDLVLFAFEHGEGGDIFVKKAPACTIEDLALAVKKIFKADNEIKIIGIRHGEKMYETLLTNEESFHAEDMGDFFRDVHRNPLTEFNSSNTLQLNADEVADKLLELRYIQNKLSSQGD